MWLNWTHFRSPFWLILLWVKLHSIFRQVCRSESGEIALHECPSEDRIILLKRCGEEPENRPSTCFAKGGKVDDQGAASNTSLSIKEKLYAFYWACSVGKKLYYKNHNWHLADYWKREILRALQWQLKLFIDRWWYIFVDFRILFGALITYLDVIYLVVNIT